QSIASEELRLTDKFLHGIKDWKVVFHILCAFRKGILLSSNYRKATSPATQTYVVKTHDSCTSCG
ncbi:hypothetical protein, partial [Comamonas sp.]